MLNINTTDQGSIIEDNKEYLVLVENVCELGVTQ
jgi:hypothetical protein